MSARHRGGIDWGCPNPGSALSSAVDFLYGLGQSLSSHGRFLRGTPGIMLVACVEHGDALSFRWSSLACGLIRDESRAQFFWWNTCLFLVSSWLWGHRGVHICVGRTLTPFPSAGTSETWSSLGCQLHPCGGPEVWASFSGVHWWEGHHGNSTWLWK